MSRRGVMRALAGTALASVAASRSRASEANWVTFDDSAGCIALDGSLNGKPARILLDSGASNIFVDAKFAAQVGLESTGQAGGATALSKSVDGVWSRPVEVQFGSFIWKSPRAMIMPFRAETADTGIEVVLGQVAFSGLPMEIDFTRKRLRLVLDKPDLEGAVRLPLRRGPHNTLYVEVVVEGGRPLSALLDTGSNMALVADRAVSRDNRFLGGRPTSDGVLVDAAGMTRITLATLKTVSLGGIEMEDVPLNALPTVVRDTPLIVGLPIISQLGRVIVDAKSGALFIFPAEVRPGPFLKNRTGLATLPLPEGGWRVVHVSKGSPAAKAGWKAGDLIANTDGQTVLPPEGRAINYAAGSRVRHEMADGSVRVLERKDYY